MAPNNNIYFGKNAFEQWAESLLCDLNRAFGYCSDMQIMIESLKQAYKNEDEALQRLVEFQGGYFFEANRKALLNKDFRVELAGLVRKVGQCYDAAACVLRRRKCEGKYE